MSVLHSTSAAPRVHHASLGSPLSYAIEPRACDAEKSTATVSVALGTRRIVERRQSCWLECAVPSLAVRFRVSRDEESIRMRVTQGSRSVDLGERIGHFSLLTLARKRLADLDDGMSDSESGWIFRDGFSHDESMSRSQLNMYIFRVRKHLRERGLAQADGIVERRSCTHELRFGTANIFIAHS
jgi:hypothetical protein